MTRNENVQRSESSKVIFIYTEEETQTVPSMALTLEPLLLKITLRVNELVCVTCDEVATGNYPLQ